MDDYSKTNRGLWDGWARINAGSKLYDLEGFKAGKTSLKPTELEELGEVEGKSLLHLQCHFGLDTLSWARMGGQATGVDFSGEAISLARSLNEELGLDARFIQSNVFDLPKVLDDQFDIVFTSYGAINWLDDIDAWAGLVARYLKPGGTFYMIEFHPFITTLDDDGRLGGDSYFYKPEPTMWEAEGSYADRDADFSHKSYEWNHSIGDVVTALIAAGLKLEFLHEFQFSAYDALHFALEQIGPDQYALPGCPNTIPFMYSIRATR